MNDKPTVSPFSDLQKDGIIVLPWIEGMEIGAGYDSLTLVPKGTPYDPKLTDLTLKPTSGSSSQTFTQDVQRIENSSQLNDALSVSASVNGSYGVFSASASATYQKKTQVNNYSLYFLINSFVRNSEEQIVKYGLSAESLAEDGNEFRSKYGDYFVEGVVSGGTLYSLLQLSTNSRETKEDITASLEAKYSGAFSIGGKFSTDISKALETKGVNFSSKWQATGASPDWNASSKHNDVDEILESANTFPKGVSEGGAPMFAILKPYSLLSQAPQTSTSINGRALDAIRQTLAGVYLQAKQILDSVNYALTNPSQFPSDKSGDLENIQAEMLKVMQQVIADNESLEKDPTKEIVPPKMPPMDQIPQRFWGGDLTVIAPPQGVVPSILKYKIGVAQTSIWSLPVGDLQNTCQAYLDQVEADVTDNLNSAYNFIQLLSGSMDALENGVNKDAATPVISALADAVSTAKEKWANAVLRQRAHYESFANKNTDNQLDFLEKVLNPILWETTSDSMQFGETAFWASLQKDTTDKLTTIGNLWPVNGESKGSEYYSFKSGLWGMLGGMFHNAMEVIYESVPS